MSAAPVLQYPGGKARQAARIVGLLPPGRTLIEPFMGAGSVTLAAASAHAGRIEASDVDADLVHFHAAVREAPDKVHAEATALDAEPTDDYYLAVREAFNAGAAPATSAPCPWRAGVLLWLNRAGYNGLYRRNRKGGYNVPFGKRAVTIPPAERLRAASRALRGVSLRAQDFEAALATAGDGDVVYLDPPYLPLKPGGFTAYSGTPFGEADHKRLHAAAHAARRRGADVLMSNHIVPATFACYPTFELALTIEEKRTINRNGDDREPVLEAVLRAR